MKKRICRTKLLHVNANWLLLLLSESVFGRFLQLQRLSCSPLLLYKVQPDNHVPVALWQWRHNRAAKDGRCQLQKLVSELDPEFCAEVKVNRNTVPGPENLSLERSGCEIIGFHSRNPRSWAQQVSNLRYSNPIVNESFKFHNVDCFYNKMLNTFSWSLIIWQPVIKTCAQEMNGGAGTNWGPGELYSTFPHLGNYLHTFI